MNTPIYTANLDLFADYFQFYIEDENNGENLGDHWTDEAIANMLAVTNKTIGIGTTRNMDVPVTLNIHNSQPKFKNDLGNFDQINECDIEIISGKIVIAGCTDYYPEAKRIEVENGIYRIRIYYGNLDKISEDGLDGDDFYIIDMWRTKVRAEVQIIKQRAGY